MFVSGHASQTMKNVPKAKTSPASSAPAEAHAERAREQEGPERPHEQLQDAVTASDHQNGRT